MNKKAMKTIGILAVFALSLLLTDTVYVASQQFAPATVTSPGQASELFVSRLSGEQAVGSNYFIHPVEGQFSWSLTGNTSYPGGLKNSWDVTALATFTGTCGRLMGCIPLQLGLSDNLCVYANPGPGIYMERTVSVIDTATNLVIKTIPVGTAVTGVAMTPDGTITYVANGNDNSVSVIDTTTTPPTMVATVRKMPSAAGVAVAPDGHYVYVGNQIVNGSITSIDTTTNLVVATVPTLNAAGTGPASTPSNSVTPRNVSGALTNLSASPGNLTATGTTSPLTVNGLTNSTAGSPTGVTMIPDRTIAYVANAGSTTVSVIDTATNLVAITLNGAERTRWISPKFPFTVSLSQNPVIYPSWSMQQNSPLTKTSGRTSRQAAI